jgi:hypothetical protein
MRYSRATDGFWVGRVLHHLNFINISYQFRNVNIYTGEAAYYTTDSLSSFWSGLQVLAGDVENAIKSHQMCRLINKFCLFDSHLLPRLEFVEKILWVTGSLGHALYASHFSSISVTPR